jgi:isopentenyl diphosphate isomerase/L-lactate dehydrogenase-like FMN-dependent dehydrogenase
LQIIRRKTMTIGKRENQPDTLTELFHLALKNMKAKGMQGEMPFASNYLASAQTNQRLLDSIFMKPSWLSPVEPDINLDLFGIKMKVPAFCSAVGKPPYLSDGEMMDLVCGMGNAGSIMMLGIGGSQLLQSAIDTGTPVIKIVKPYRDTELIYKKIQDAESRGCIAIGIDVDYSYGMYRDGKATRVETFSPKKFDELRQAISLTKLPFIIKGVLSISDAEKAIELGTSAIIVSNHGHTGSFDFGTPSVVALPEIVEAVGDRVTVLVDSGFRTGNDVFKGMALGAQAVGFATSVMMALNAGGADYVEQFINFIASELKRTMAICGCA